MEITEIPLSKLRTDSAMDSRRRFKVSYLHALRDSIVRELASADLGPPGRP